MNLCILKFYITKRLNVIKLSSNYNLNKMKLKNLNLKSLNLHLKQQQTFFDLSTYTQYTTSIKSFIRKQISPEYIVTITTKKITKSH